HNETFPQVSATLDEYSANVVREQAQLNQASRALGRRGFLVGMGGVAALGALAACGSSTTGPRASDASATPTPTGSASATSKYTGDLKVVALAAALENLAVAAYKDTLMRATAGKLGTVPPAIATFVTTVMKQHSDHAAAWNAVLTKSNLPAVTGTPLTIASGAVAMLDAATTVPAVAKIALGLENSAADTYTFAAANVTDPGGIMTAATIQPVETMHAAILSFVLGEYPVPLSFIGIDQAVKPDALTV
ncbi:MAG: hypothetical protein JWN96_4595, partial [Mycobacterium sp.]|nr:hypothetical protein [Mycobacterium sp.]